MKKRISLIISLLIVTIFTTLLSGCGSKKITTLKIGSEQFPESKILAEMTVALIEANTDLKAEHLKNFGGSSAMHNAMVSDELDAYPTYTGSQFTGVFRQEVTDEWKDPKKVFNYVKDQFDKQYDVYTFEPFGFNNTYCITLQNEKKEQLGISTTSELVEHSQDMIIATEMTFQKRQGDGYDDFAKAYGLKFKDVNAMDYGLLYRAVRSGDVDTAVAYSTDGRLKAMNLAILEDDKHFFPPYDGILVMRNKALKEHPELEELLKKLSGLVDTKTMTDLNYQVDSENREPSDVARDFLKEKGLIK